MVEVSCSVRKEGKRDPTACYNINSTRSRVTCIKLYFLLAILCEILSKPANGEVTWNGLNTGSMATYTCESGFNLAGNQTRTCQSSGLWSGRTPKCTCAQKCKSEVGVYT